jgi:hypothetical protein
MLTAYNLPLSHPALDGFLQPALQEEIDPARFVRLADESIFAAPIDEDDEEDDEDDLEEDEDDLDEDEEDEDDYEEDEDENDLDDEEEEDEDEEDDLDDEEDDEDEEDDDFPEDGDSSSVKKLFLEDPPSRSRSRMIQ